MGTGRVNVSHGQTLYREADPLGRVARGRQRLEAHLGPQLEDLTVANGNVAIRANGDVTARRVRFTNNQAPNFFGGAILAEAALDLADVTFDGNVTNNDGAAGLRATLAAGRGLFVRA